METQTASKEESRGEDMSFELQINSKIIGTYDTIENLLNDLRQGYRHKKKYIQWENNCIPNLQEVIKLSKQKYGDVEVIGNWSVEFTTKTGYTYDIEVMENK